MFGSFNVCADVDACDCTQGLYKHHTRDCTVSWLWGENPFCCFWGNKLASVLCPAFWSCALPAELFCPFGVFSSEWADFVYWHYMVTQAILLFLRSGHELGRVVSPQGGLRRGVVSPRGGLERGVISLRLVLEGGVSLRVALEEGWFLLKMVLEEGCSPTSVVLEERWSLVKVVLEEEWSLLKVVLKEGGLSLRWS